MTLEVVAIGAGIAVAAWGLRRVILAPWATYVSHSELKDGTVFMTVKRIHWYPPFLEYRETWYASRRGWHRELDGRSANASLLFDREGLLCAILVMAQARVKETEELVK